MLERRRGSHHAMWDSCRPVAGRVRAQMPWGAAGEHTRKKNQWLTGVRRCGDLPGWWGLCFSSYLRFVVWTGKVNNDDDGSNRRETKTVYSLKRGKTKSTPSVIRKLRAALKLGPPRTPGWAEGHCHSLPRGRHLPIFLPFCSLWRSGRDEGVGPQPAQSNCI